jgi:predicted nucleic acid-binding protein
MPTEVFLDTAYAIALSSPNDQFHTRAVALAERLEATGTRLVTTRAVLLARIIHESETRPWATSTGPLRWLVGWLWL